MIAKTIFAELKSVAENTASGFVFRRVLPDSPWEVRLEVRHSDFRHRLVVIAPESIADDQNVTLKGLQIEVNSDPVCLTIDLIDNRLIELFCTLTDDIISQLGSLPVAANPVGEVQDRLALWRRMFAESDGEGLTLEQQRGLFCELLCLRDIAIPATGATKALTIWKAPFGSSIDFVAGSVGIEVKSRFKKGGTKVRISSEHQLDPIGLRLFLAVYSLSDETGQTLNELVEAVRVELRESTVAQLSYEDSLLSYGYHGVHKHKYEHQRFNSTLSVFEVRQGFPRILSTDLLDGVSNVAYDVELTACAPFAVSSEIVLESLSVDQNGN